MRKRNHFGWEHKGKRRPLDAAYAQLQQYAAALENPPLLIVSGTETIILRPNRTNSVSRPIVLRIEELRDAGRRAVLKSAFTNPAGPNGTPGSAAQGDGTGRRGGRQRAPPPGADRA